MHGADGDACPGHSGARQGIEIFGNDGEVSLTSCLLPKDETTGLELRAKGGEAVIRSLRVTKLKSAWDRRRPDPE